jgi:cholesterol transport system auxiliary component
MSRSAPILLAVGLLCLGAFGCTSRAPATYDLVTPKAYAGKKAPYQLVVYEPTTVSALETNRLMVRPQADQVSYYKGVAWSDRLPVLVQARLIESFQNSGAVKSVSSTSGQYGLATEIRAFQVDVTPSGTAVEVDIFAKLIDTGSGRIIATRGFNSRVPARTDAPDDVIAALNQAFTKVVQDTTIWVAASSRA